MNTWNDTILLTGATGFLGSHLLKGLLEKKCKVIILKRSSSNTWRIDQLLNRVKSYDIDNVSLKIVFEEQRIDSVIHTATQYGRKQVKLTEMLETNLIFGLHLLELARATNVGLFVNTDTFFNVRNTKYKYLDQYSKSKSQFVDWCKYFSNNSDLKIINMKIQHMYGPMDNPDKFVSWIINQISNGVSEINLTKGGKRRDFIYIDDVVHAFLLVLAERENLTSRFTEFNIGTGKPITIKEFINTVSKVINQTVPVKSKLNFGALPYRLGEPNQRKVNVKKLIKLGWAQKISIEEGIRIILNL